MKKIITQFLLLILILSCDLCRKPIKDDYYKKDTEVFDAQLNINKPEYETLCPMCYRQMQYIYQKYYQEKEGLK